MPFGATITGVGAHVPERTLTNEDLCQLVDTTDEWIVTRTGIRERRIAAPEEGTSHLATHAGAAALQDAGLSASDLDLIIVATSTPDLAFPPSACLVQHRLGAAKAAAFDLNGACAGFLQALATGAQFIQSGAYQHVLVIGADVYSRLVDYQDRTTCILFGDGAGAVVLSRAPEGSGLLDFTLHSRGELAGLVYSPHPSSPSATIAEIEGDPKPYISQNGKAVFKAAVPGMAEAVRSLLDRQGLSVEDLRVLVPHQANGRIMSAVAQSVGIPEEKVANVVAEFGNTSAATIPLALERWVRTKGLNEGDLVMFTAFAGGLLWGAALLRWGGLKR